MILSSLARSALMPAVLVAAFGLAMPDAVAKERPKRPSTASQSGDRSSIIVVRIWKDGRECPTGTARLRPLRDGQLDTSRYVDIGRFNKLNGIENAGRALGNMVTLNISALLEAAKTRPLKESLIPIAPGAYVLTWISCNHGNSREWIGVDRPIFVFQESGRVAPVKGANHIEVRPGEVIDAGVLEIRSDEVGFFEQSTASVVAQPAPPHERDALREVASNVRFTTFSEKFGKP
jgi:hypothetical protein